MELNIKFDHVKMKPMRLASFNVTTDPTHKKKNKDMIPPGKGCRIMKNESVQIVCSIAIKMKMKLEEEEEEVCSYRN